MVSNVFQDVYFQSENEMQKSKIRTLNIRPAAAASCTNASVDELRDAIGNITIAKSNTFDKVGDKGGGLLPTVCR